MSTGSDVCLWSADEWRHITGANKTTTDVPSWLQVYKSPAIPSTSTRANTIH